MGCLAQRELKSDPGHTLLLGQPRGGPGVTKVYRGAHFFRCWHAVGKKPSFFSCFKKLLKFPGVQEVKERKWRSYLANASKMPVLEKVKSVFLIEPYEDDVILRSRTCRLE